MIARMASDPSRACPTRTSTARSPAWPRANPAWSAGDVEAKAEALVQLDVDAARAVLLENGDWDGGLADLSDPAAAGILDIWLDPGRPGRRRLRSRRGAARRSPRGSAPTTS